MRKSLRTRGELQVVELSDAKRHAFHFRLLVCGANLQPSEAERLEPIKGREEAVALILSNSVKTNSFTPPNSDVGDKSPLIT